MPNSEKVLKTLIDYRKQEDYSYDVCYEFMLFALIKDFLKVDTDIYAQGFVTDDALHEDGTVECHFHFDPAMIPSGVHANIMESMEEVKDKDWKPKHSDETRNRDGSWDFHVLLEAL